MIDEDKKNSFGKNMPKKFEFEKTNQKRQGLEKDSFFLETYCFHFLLFFGKFENSGQKFYVNLLVSIPIAVIYGRIDPRIPCDSWILGG